MIQPPPNIIYLQWYDPDCGKDELRVEQTWCENRIEEHDPAYILKEKFDTVIAERDALKTRKDTPKEASHD